MQFLRLYETCRMICYWLLSNDVNFAKIGFKWLCFGAFQCEYFQQNPLFLGKNFGDTRHPYEKKMNPPSIILGGGGCTVRPPGS